ncbi:MAG TPA: hypothetical protein VH186_05910 [Chloroflexia bacterium]|nr:hypothetical protein [Chloroflexia bacterium]
MQQLPAQNTKTENSSIRASYYHATQVNLDGKPLFARGALPTIHSSLTYAVWYIYWMSHLSHISPVPAFYIYELSDAERYLISQGDGLYSVSEIGTIPYDDRVEGVLDHAPELFHKKWDWNGKLTYVPARCLHRLDAGSIRQNVNHDEWLRLCQKWSEARTGFLSPPGSKFFTK